MSTRPDSTDSLKPTQEGSCGEPSFEQTLVRLEEIVHLLEDGKIGLDDALARYEEGVGLLRKAYEMLEGAERKIALLTGLDAEGNPVLRPVEDAASFSLTQNAGGPLSSATRTERTSPRRTRRGSESETP